MAKRPYLSSEIRRVLAIISDIITGQKSIGCTLLPGINELSNRIGFSRGTIYKALHYLENHGVLVIRPRKDIQIIMTEQNKEFLTSLKHNLNQPDTLTLQPKWKELKDCILEKITNHTYPPGYLLPTIKELCYEYGTSYRVLHKALQAAVEEGKLERFKKGYRVCKISKGVGGSTIVFFQEYIDKIVLEGSTPHAVKYWPYIENECQRMNISLLAVAISRVPDSTKMVPPNLQKLIKNIESEYSVLGYIVPTIFSPEGLEIVPFLLKTIGNTGKPVAILEESKALSYDTIKSNCPHARIFALATGNSSGKIVGNYLVELGHRKAAFFPPKHEANDDIPNTRLKGIAETFTCATTSISIFNRPVPKSKQLAFSSQNFNLFISSLRPVVRDFIRKYGLRNECSVYVSYCAKIYTDLELRSVLYHDDFNDALAQSGITAWVCYNDTIALGALDFLKSKGVEVPKTISVIGFDDTIEGLGRGLTSYNFNIPAIIDAILAYLLFPMRKLKKGPPDIVEIPGKIMERESTNSKRSSIRAIV